MMPYLIYAVDYEGMDAEREAIRSDHRKYLQSFGEKVLASGALLADDQNTVIGGITLLDVESRDEAIAFEKDDPYAIRGIRNEVKIIYWRKRWWDGAFLVKQSL